MLLLLSTLNCFLSGQELGQVMYVAAKQGLRLRSEPDLKSKTLELLSLNDSITVREILYRDTIDLRVSNWISCTTSGNQKGYLFSGYLNQYPLPLNGYASLRDYIHEYLKVNFLELSATEYVDDQPGDKYDKILRLSFGNDYVLKSIYEWESADVDLILYQVNLSEIINLVEYAELHGENEEHRLLKEAFLRQQSLNLFVYTHAIGDPPEKTIIIESIYPGGVRIRISDRL